MAKINCGGQAVIDGVMMRGLRRATVAVRKEDGSIITFHEALNHTRRSTLEQIPLIRGVLLLWDTLNLGIRALNVAAAVGLPPEERLNDRETAGSVAFSLLFAFAAARHRANHLRQWIKFVGGRSKQFSQPQLKTLKHTSSFL